MARQTHTSKNESRHDGATMPSDIDHKVGFFDRIATAVDHFTAKAWFFSICVALILIWAPSVVLFNLDTWQLIINTATTIVTFLLVALLQNTEARANDAVQQKLNSIADVLSELAKQVGDNTEVLQKKADEARQAVGLEDDESTQ
jgi:low affinity Fe/Cu permease